MRPALFAVLALVGCGTENEVGLIESWSLQVTLGTDSAIAGEHVDVAVELVSETGATEAVDGWEVASDAEERLVVGADTLRPTVAATHALAFTADARGASWGGVAALDVLPGPIHVVDLDLSDHQTVAGTPLAWSVTAADLWGNRVDVTGTEPSTDSVDVDVDATTLVSTVPGIYVAWVDINGVSDEETFVVVPADPDFIDLTLSTTDLEVGETAVATVDIQDVWGNPVDAPWTLAAEGPGTVDISWTNLTFLDEGPYTVTATVDGTALSDSVGPFLIDSTGPVITLDSPERGDWVDGTSSTVSGTVTDAWSAVTSLTVDGQSVAVASDGSFSTTARWDFGLNVLEVSATDSDGNTSVDTRAVLAGDFSNYGSAEPDGIQARVHEGAGGLGTLEEIGEGLVAATDLDTLIPSPAYSNTSKTCTWFGCVTWYSVSLYVTNPAIGSTDLTLDPRSTGLLRGTFVLYDPSLDWSASGKLVGISYSGSGDISADSITVTIDLDPWVYAGTIYADVYSVSVSSTNFDFDWDSWLADVLDFFGVDLDGILAGYIEDAIEDAVYAELPGVIEDLLQGLELATDLDIAGRTYAFDAVPSDIHVDATGLTLDLDTTFDVDSWESDYTGLGVLDGGYAVPSWTGSPGMIAALDVDFLNQALYAMWGGGLLDQTIRSDELGLDAADLQVFFPTLTFLDLDTEALLPPVIVPSAAGLQLQLGDYHLALYNGTPSTGDLLLEVYVSAFVDLDIDVDTSTGLLTPSIGTPELYFDVVYPAANSAGASDAEALLEALVPLLLPAITDGLAEIPIPEFSGFSLSGVSIDLLGSDYGYVGIGGDLQAD